MTNQEAIKHIGLVLISIEMEIRKNWTILGVERINLTLDNIAAILKNCSLNEAMSDPDQYFIRKFGGILGDIPKLSDDWRKSEVQGIFDGLGKLRAYYDGYSTKDLRISQYDPTMIKITGIAHQYETSPHCEGDEMRRQVGASLKSIKLLADEFIADESNGENIAITYLLRIRRLVEPYDFDSSTPQWDSETTRAWDNTVFDIADIGRDYKKMSRNAG